MLSSRARWCPAAVLVVSFALVCCLVLADWGVAATAPAGRDRDPVSTSDLVQGGRELAAERSVTSRTFRVAKGAYVTRVYGSAVHERRSGGAMGRLATGLERRGEAYALEGDGVSVRLPVRLRGGAVRVARGESAVGYSLVDAAAGTPELDGTTAVYRDAFEQTDVRVTALAGGVKEDLQLTGPGSPASFAFDLTVPTGAHVRLAERGQITIDGAGKQDFVIAAPFMYDAGRAFAPKRAARYALRKTAGGHRVTLALDEKWLGDSKRRWPVTVDPTVTATGATQTTDASLLESVPDSGYGTSDGIFLGEYDAYPGYDNRAALRFDLSDVPADARVLHAKVGLKSYFSESSVAKKVSLHALNQSFTTDATWNTYDGTDNWSAAGGDFDGTAAAVATVGDTLGWHYWHPTELVQGWVDGTRQNQGMLLKDVPGEPNNGTEFRSSEYGTAADRPYIDVMWHPRTGIAPTYTFDEHQLKDGSVLKVNLQNGNVVLTRPAVIGTGPGEDFLMGHYFNSMLEGTTTTGGFGASPWVAANGKFVGGTVMDNGDFIHQGLTGYVLPFVKQTDGSFNSPPELDATLTEDTGAGWGERYELEFSDGSKMTFAEDGTWTSHTDRDGNSYTLNYPSPSYQHTSVTGTDDEDTTFTYTTGSQSQDLLSTVTNPEDVEFTYTYTSDRLTGEARDSASVATYSYDGTGRLASITDGDNNVTELSFDAEGRVQSITDGSNSNDPTTSYDYAEPDVSCGDEATTMTMVANPDGLTDGHCFSGQGRALDSATSITGEASGDLVVAPSADPQTSSFTSGTTAWVIARMPSTKTIDRVTLGDFGKASGCGSATTASVRIELLTGSNYGAYTEVGSGTADIPAAAGLVNWTLSYPTSGQLTLEKDKSYRFVVSKTAGCDLVRTTWRHDASAIDGGSRACNHGPERTPEAIGFRIWHLQGNTETNCQVTDMDSSLRSGWYSVTGSGPSTSIKAGQARIPPIALSWLDETCNYRYYFGNHPVDDGLLYGLVPEDYPDPAPGWEDYTALACRWANYAPYGTKPAGGWHYAPAWQPSAVMTRPRAMYARLAEVSNEELLEQYAPHVQYHTDESFFADAWQTATDTPETLLFRRGDGGDTVLASGAGTSIVAPSLSSAWLVGSQYPAPGGPVQKADFLDFGSDRDVDMSDAASGMRAISSATYADKVYGRAVRGSNGDLYLQYWFWYLYNDSSASGVTNHEGDWELAQIHLDDEEEPVFATYSQHGHQETCAWGFMFKTEGHPQVWPAKGRHANYFSSGEHPSEFFGSPDVTDSGGRSLVPQVVDVSNAPGFLQWPGQWGSSLDTTWLVPEASSPRGPAFQPGRRWSDPAYFEEQAKDGCEVE